jgi:hypothetical protein
MTRVTGAAIGIAAVIYYTWLFAFLCDPETSWVHIESAMNFDTVNALARQPRGLYDGLTKGLGIDPQPDRFRPISHAVEFFDTYLRHPTVWMFGFVPALSNISSLLYFAFCPIVALLIARQLVGTSLAATVFTILALGALITSVGYMSASMFVFRPAKKLLILGALLQFLLLIWYVRAPSARLAGLVIASQIALALTDETGIALGVLISAAMTVVAVFWHRRYVDAVVAVLAGVVTIWFFFPRSDHNTGAEFADADVMWHLAGSFSLLYGIPLAHACMVFALMAAFALAVISTIQRDVNGLIMLGAAVLLVINAWIATVLLKYGGALFISVYGYYYGSLLSALAFIVACASWRFADGKAFGRAIQIGLIVGLAGAIAGNLEYMPRLNRVVAMFHYNPFSYPAMNVAGAQFQSGRAREAPCTKTEGRERYEAELDALGVRPEWRQEFIAYWEKPFTDDRFFNRVFGLMLRQPPPEQRCLSAGGA